MTTPVDLNTPGYQAGNIIMIIIVITGRTNSEVRQTASPRQKNNKDSRRAMRTYFKIEAVSRYGRRSSSAIVGSSVPSASAPIVSMIRLTHSSCTGDSGGLRWDTAEMKTSKTATTLTVSWNCKNLRMLSASGHITSTLIGKYWYKNTDKQQPVLKAYSLCAIVV